jgi:excisionase family DNA binding protein
MKALTPPQVASLIGVNADKVLTWIRRGELRALNVSEGIRPRWRIEHDDLMAFKATLANTPAQPARGLHRNDPNVIRYF